VYLTLFLSYGVEPTGSLPCLGFLRRSSEVSRSHIVVCTTVSLDNLDPQTPRRNVFLSFSMKVSIVCHSCLLVLCLCRFSGFLTCIVFFHLHLILFLHLCFSSCCFFFLLSVLGSSFPLFEVRVSDTFLSEKRCLPLMYLQFPKTTVSTPGLRMASPPPPPSSGVDFIPSNVSGVFSCLALVLLSPF